MSEGFLIIFNFFFFFGWILTLSPQKDEDLIVQTHLHRVDNLLPGKKFHMTRKTLIKIEQGFIHSGGNEKIYIT